MNVSISLLKRTGLTKEEVEQARQSLLSVATNTEKKLKEIEKQIASVERDNKFWSGQLRKRTPTKKCIKCRGEIEVWPFNDSEGYFGVTSATRAQRGGK